MASGSGIGSNPPDVGLGSAAEQDELLLRRDIRRILIALGPFVGVGLLAVLTYGAGCPDGMRLSGLATAMVAGAAAALVGALLGLLFGVPRSLSQTSAPTAPPAGGAEASARPQPPSSEGYGGNSNLEQISDWLTKILVGATLVQAGTLYDRARELAKALAGGLCSNGEPASSAATAFAGGQLACFATWGFFLGYLLTRRVLPAMLRRGEEEGHGVTEQDRSAVSTVAAATTSSASPAGRTRKAVLDEHPGSQAAVLRFDAIPFENVAPRDLPAWASAKMLLESYDQAVRGFDAALTLRVDAPGAAEHLMFSALYLPSPAGFETAIKTGEAAATRTPAMDAYLACAYGQRHRWERGRGAGPDVLKPLRDNAFAAAKRALEGDPTWLETFKSLMDPKGSTDDDFETFRDDADFRALVGLDGA